MPCSHCPRSPPPRNAPRNCVTRLHHGYQAGWGIAAMKMRRILGHQQQQPHPTTLCRCSQHSTSSSDAPTSQCVLLCASGALLYVLPATQTRWRDATCSRLQKTQMLVVALVFIIHSPRSSVGRACTSSSCRAGLCRVPLGVVFT